MLSHEIAHCVAHHVAETQSRYFIGLGLAAAVAYALGTSFDLVHQTLDLAYSLPGSRTQEAEADYIGLLMMARSCYDPNEALELWRRMERGGQQSPPQLLSTHPSNHNRIGAISGWLPEAFDARARSTCRQLDRCVSEFQHAFEEPEVEFW